MNTKIKLDRDELKGLITILKVLDDNWNDTHIIEFLSHKEINSMRQKFTAKLISSTRKFNLAITNYQVSLLFEILNNCADNFQPFERSIALGIISQIDRQYHNHMALLMNFATEQGKQNYLPSSQNEKMLSQ